MKIALRFCQLQPLEKEGCLFTYRGDFVPREKEIFRASKSF